MFAENFDILSAGLVIRCQDFAESLDFFTQSVGFRVESIFPADGPTHANLTGFGVRLHLEVGSAVPASIRLTLPPDHPLIGRELVSPCGTTVSYVGAKPGMNVVPLVSSLVVEHETSDGAWHVGRAGMLYRDLVPDRQGGAIIASHIRIPTGGLVPDYVHFHEVLFQLIFCRSGWARLVYEDQGDPFVLRAGDCVIQPPTIRHRVLESSDNLQVVEIGYPAEHITKTDPDTALPTADVNTSRTWGGQTFVRHIAESAQWIDLSNQVRMADTGIRFATEGMTNVEVIRAQPGGTWRNSTVDKLTFEFLFVLSGSAEVATSEMGLHGLSDGTSMVIPPGNSYEVAHGEASEILKLSLRASC